MRKAVALTLTLSLASAVFAGGTVVSLDKLNSKAPANWKEKPSEFKTRLFTFIPPKAEGDERDAEIQVIFFGPGSGGGLEENIKRWKGMFKAADGKNIDDATKVEKLDLGKAKAVVVDISGTYLDKFPPFAPNAKTIPRENYRRINVFFDSENGPYYIIFVGPAKTVAQNKKAFDDWLKNFK